MLAYERQLLALDKQGEKGKLVSTLKAEMKEVRSGKTKGSVYRTHPTSDLLLPFLFVINIFIKISIVTLNRF